MGEGFDADAWWEGIADEAGFEIGEEGMVTAAEGAEEFEINFAWPLEFGERERTEAAKEKI